MAKIMTIFGEMDESELHKKELIVNGAQVVEYYLKNSDAFGVATPVHRSAFVQLKGVAATAVAQKL